MLQKSLLKQLRQWVLALAAKHTKEVAYQTLVRPQLEYAAPIWHPYNETVEKVQKTAAGWVCRRWHNTSSVDDMLDELEWPSLEDRRLNEVFLNIILRDSLRHSEDALKNSFFPRTIPVWNCLSSSVVASTSKTTEEF